MRKNYEALGSFRRLDRPAALDLLGFASQLVFTAQPSNAVTGASIGTVTVAIEDVYGNVVTANTSTVTLATTSSLTGTTCRRPMAMSADTARRLSRAGAEPASTAARTAAEVDSSSRMAGHRRRA